jgi:hypothetical protein
MPPQKQHQLNQEDILKLREEPPLTAVVIDGVTYNLGTVGAEDAEKIKAIGKRLADGTACGDDLSPLQIFRALLLAADPDVDLGGLRKVRWQTVLAANREYFRQRVVAALDPGAAAGRA